MNEELKDEIEALQSMYNENEIVIINQEDTGILNVRYIANLDKYTQIKLEISLKYYSSLKPNYAITIYNAPNTKKLLPPQTLQKIATVLTQKYAEMADSMPLFQCINYCNEELMNDEDLNLSDTLKAISIIDDGSAVMEEVEKYRAERRKAKKHNNRSSKPCMSSDETEHKQNKESADTATARHMLASTPCLSAVIPTEKQVRQWVESRYHAKDLQIQFICNVHIIDRFLNVDDGKEFAVVYHGTDSLNNDSIIQRGLICGGTKGVAVVNGAAYGKGVYCSPSLDVAGGYARGSIFICIVRIKNCARNGQVYVVPNDRDILPVYLVSGNIGCYSRKVQQVNTNNQIIAHVFDYNFRGNAKSNHRKAQRKWSAFHKLNL